MKIIFLIETENFSAKFWVVLKILQVINSPKYVGITENYLCFHRVRKAPRWSRVGYDVSLFKRIVCHKHFAINERSCNSGPILILHSIIMPLKYIFELLWKMEHLLHWSKCSIFSIYFQKYSKLYFNFSWVFSMLSKNRNDVMI